MPSEFVTIRMGFLERLVWPPDRVIRTLAPLDSPGSVLSLAFRPFRTSFSSRTWTLFSSNNAGGMESGLQTDFDFVW